MAIKFSGKGNVVVTKATAPTKASMAIAKGSANPTGMRAPSK